MSQNKIAKQLKAVTIIIASVGLFFFGTIGYMILKSNSLYNSRITQVPVIILLVVTAVLCYAVLYQFWKVCTEIGKDNSFSYENYSAFRKMSIILCILSGVWVLFLIGYIILADTIQFLTVFKMTGYTIVWGGIAALAGILAKLIEKARQIREENDLTI